MKAFLLFISVFASNYIFAQNSVGIGTINPQATLDVLRGTAPNGTAAFRGTTNTSNFNLGINEDTYIRGGKAGSHVILNDLPGSGNVGIGISGPYSPLTFNNITGEKISFYGNANNNYGLGIVGYTLQIHTDAASADIAFGYGSSGAFNETMRIKGNGNVGIGGYPQIRLHIYDGPSGYAGGYYPGITLEGDGQRYLNLITPSGYENGILFGNTNDAVSGGIIYNNPGNSNGLQFRTNGNATRMIISSDGKVGIGVNYPAYQLDVSNRMRIRSGGNNGVSAGLWFNNNVNTEAAFIGMEDDMHVGVFGIGSGWIFGMNTQTGALRINGSEGNPGQVLVSNGGSASAGYTTIGNVINSDMKNATSSFSVTTLGTEYHIPQLTHTITLTRKSRVIISANTSFQMVICIGCNGASGYFRLKVDGTAVTTQLYSVSPSSFSGASIGNFMVDLNAGAHNIDFYIEGFSGPAHYVFPKYSSIIILPID
jgi:hypothetical protein